MNTCKNCRNKLRFWQFVCPVCRSNIWKVPQILFLSTIFIGLFGVAIGVISFSSLDPAQETFSEPNTSAKPKDNIKVDLPASGTERRTIQSAPAQTPKVRKSTGLTRQQRKQRRMERKGRKNK